MTKCEMPEQKGDIYKMLSKKLKQIIEFDRMNDRERLAAIKFMQDFTTWVKISHTSPVSLLSLLTLGVERQ